MVVLLFVWLYVNFVVGGNWFLSFAFPTAGGIALIVCTVVALVRYVKKGKLYIVGGAFITLGLFMLLVEYLLDATFRLSFVGWSIYPLVVMVILGGTMIYLAIDSAAREVMERKLFF